MFYTTTTTTTTVKTTKRPTCCKQRHQEKLPSPEVCCLRLFSSWLLDHKDDDDFEFWCWEGRINGDDDDDNDDDDDVNLLVRSTGISSANSSLWVEAAMPCGISFVWGSPRFWWRWRFDDVVMMMMMMMWWWCNSMQCVKSLLCEDPLASVQKKVKLCPNCLKN